MTVTPTPVDSRITYRQIDGTAAYSRTLTMRSMRLVLGLRISKTMTTPGTTRASPSTSEHVTSAYG